MMPRLLFRSCYALGALCVVCLAIGCSNYEARFQQQIADRKAGKALGGGGGAAPAAGDARLFAAPLDVADKNAQPTNIRLQLPKFFFTDAGQPAFQALAPNDASPAASKRTRGAGTGLPPESVLITYEATWTDPADSKPYPVSIVFAQFGLGQAPALTTYFDGRTPVSPTDLASSQGTWQRHEFNGPFEQYVSDTQMAAVDGTYLLYKATSKSRDVVIGFFAQKKAADAVQLKDVADASLKSVVLTEGM